MMNSELYATKETVCVQSQGFSAEAGEDIGYERGAKMVKNHCDQNDGKLATHFFGRNILEAILSQPGAVGISVVNGLSKTGQSTPVLVGVNVEGHYIIDAVSIGINGEMTKQKGIVAGGGVMSPGTPPPTTW